MLLKERNDWYIRQRGERGHTNAMEKDIELLTESLEEMTEKYGRTLHRKSDIARYTGMSVNRVCWVSDVLLAYGEVEIIRLFDTEAYVGIKTHVNKVGSKNRPPNRDSQEVTEEDVSRLVDQIKKLKKENGLRKQYVSRIARRMHISVGRVLSIAANTDKITAVPIHESVTMLRLTE